jgi:ABC-type lipoprotein release transport system permease subunit
MLCLRLDSSFILPNILPNMTLSRLLLRNLLYHWRGNLPVMLGVLVGTAVLTGALLVGDSLRGSLRDRTARRLGWVHQALVAPRFFRAELAAELAGPTSGRVTPALLLRGTAGAGAGDSAAEVRGVSVLGVDEGFFAPQPPPEGFPGPVAEPRAWLSAALADALGVQAGSALTLRLQKPEALPRETVLGSKKAEVEKWDLTVAGVLGGDAAGNHFNLRPDLEAPHNVLLSLPALQKLLGQPGQANALLADADPAALQTALGEKLTLADWGLSVATPRSRAEALSRKRKRSAKPPYAGVIARAVKGPRPTREAFEAYFLREHPYLALESKQLLLTPAVASAALAAAKEVDLESAPTLVYLCKVTGGGRTVAGVVAATTPDRPWPLGPFLPPGKRTLGEDEIVLVDEGWPAKRPAAGERVVLTYKPPESHGPAPNRTRTFRLAGYIPMQGAAADPYLTPEFPGITDKDDPSEWKLPFDDPAWDRETIRKEYTDRYWDAYRAAPRAYVRLQAGQMLWGSRFGDLTSVRLAPRSPADLEAKAKTFEAALREKLKPAEGGFVFEPVLASALKASDNGTPFDLLFLGFSLFLIVSALMLVGLLVRLNLDRRARQVGVLLAEGYRRATVRWLLLGEGAVIALVGVALGTLAALAYARLLLDLLAALWPGGGLQSFLRPHATPLSLAVGAGAALAVSLLTIAWVVRGLAKVPPRALLAGKTTGEGEAGLPRRPRWPARVALAAGLCGAVLLGVGPLMPGQEAQAGTFFGSGALFLVAGVAGVLAWMRREQFARVEGHGWWNVGRLGLRNAARNPARSLLVVGLLASASFLLVAVESFRRTAEAGNGSPAGPDGGFALVAESDLPVFRDLNSPAGRDELIDRLEFRLQNEQAVPPNEVKKRTDAARALLARTTVVALRLRPGDDVSCQNLYQPRSPRVLGVPDALIERGGFQFDSSLAATPEEKAKPWLILQRDAPPVPVFGEAHAVAYVLNKDQGQTVEVTDSRGAPEKLLIAGLLHDSVFQSSLLASEGHFLKLFPGTEGYNYFLIAPPKGEEDAVKRLLETALADRGVVVERSADKLRAYLEVENTYITTFQALGGLGLLLGSLGLAVVLLRAVWERRGELALLRALGYRRATLGWLVLAENGFLLLAGLAVGSAAALLSILPQLLSGAGSPPWRNLLLLFAGVLAAALGAGAAALAGALRTPIVPALRRE